MRLLKNFIMVSLVALLLIHSFAVFTGEQHYASLIHWESETAPTCSYDTPWSLIYIGAPVERDGEVTKISWDETTGRGSETYPITISTDNLSPGEYVKAYTSHTVEETVTTFRKCRVDYCMSLRTAPSVWTAHTPLGRPRAETAYKKDNTQVKLEYYANEFIHSEIYTIINPSALP